MVKTYEDINEKIRKGKAVVVTAEEIIKIVEEKGLKKAAEEIDVVTTATFGPMCSSGAFINFGHSNPKIKANKVWLNGVPAYAGLAAVDIYIGATELQEGDPANTNHPGQFKYGGGHVIHDLVAGKKVKLKAIAYGTDCYPNKEVETTVTLDNLNESYLFNPRNAYQNYNVAVNLSDKTIYTYMGTLKPKIGNANYCSAGQLSPLLNDPNYETIGIGTRIWVAGNQGYIAWQGTQHSPNTPRNEKGIPKGGAGTLAIVADLKGADPQFLKGVSFQGYGVSLAVGLGIPIPILNEDVLKATTIKDEDIVAPITDYSDAYPNCKPGNLGFVSYAELKSGEIEIQGKKVKTASISSYAKAREIAEKLKKEIKSGKFLLNPPAQLLPQKGSDTKFKPLKQK